MSNAEDHSAESSDSEDALHVAAKGWNRIISAANKAGYRDGIEEGSESVSQEAFDQGYADGFKMAFALGKFKSLLNVTPNDKENLHHVNEILETTRRGACYICEVENKGTSKVSENKSFSEIVNEQRSHSKRVIEELDTYFKPITEGLSLDAVNIE